MKVLVIDGVGGALDWVLRAEAAGHQVKWFAKPRTKSSSNLSGTGLVKDKVTKWEKWMKWAELIVVTDSAFYMAAIQGYMDRGYPVFGPNLTGVRLEKDRAYGQKVLKAHGIEVAPFEVFTSEVSAEEFLLKHTETFVVKPSGDIAAERSLSHVAKSRDDLLFTLRKWKHLGKMPSKFMLQQKIDGIEMGVGGWFGTGGWLPWWEENFEFKKLMPGDLGPNCGEQGTVIRYTKKSKLADEMLQPLSEYLHEINYVGNVDINCIIDESGHAWPLEFTCRLGWPAFCIQQIIHLGDPVDWMLGLLHDMELLDARTGVAVGVVLSQPDYPYHNYDGGVTSGIPLYNLESVWDEIHPQEVMFGTYPAINGNKVVELQGHLTTGDYILVAASLESTVSKAAEKAEATLKKIKAPASLMYRTDIGRRLEEQLPKLQKHGYAKGMEF